MWSFFSKKKENPADVTFTPYEQKDPLCVGNAIHTNVGGKYASSNDVKAQLSYLQFRSKNFKRLIDTRRAAGSEPTASDFKKENLISIAEAAIEQKQDKNLTIGKLQVGLNPEEVVEHLQNESHGFKSKTQFFMSTDYGQSRHALSFLSAGNERCVLYDGNKGKHDGDCGALSKILKNSLSADYHAQDVGVISIKSPS